MCGQSCSVVALASLNHARAGWYRDFYGPMAQLVARLVRNEKVASSILARSTNLLQGV